MVRNKKFLLQMIRERQLEEYSFNDPKLMMEKFHTELKALTLFQKALLANGIFSESAYNDFFVAAYGFFDSKKTPLFEYEESDGKRALRLYNIERLLELNKETAGSPLEELKPLF